MTVTVWDELDIRMNAIIKLPAVLLPENATETDPTADPCTALDCTIEMPVLPGLIVILRRFVAVCEFLSFTWTVNVLVPVAVGVPEIVPVDGPSARPTGKVPDATVQEYGVVPPVAARVAL